MPSWPRAKFATVGGVDCDPEPAHEEDEEVEGDLPRWPPGVKERIDSASKSSQPGARVFLVTRTGFLFYLQKVAIKVWLTTARRFEVKRAPVSAQFFPARAGAAIPQTGKNPGGRRGSPAGRSFASSHRKVLRGRGAYFQAKHSELWALTEHRPPGFFGRVLPAALTPRKTAPAFRRSPGRCSQPR